METSRTTGSDGSEADAAPDPAAGVGPRRPGVFRRAARGTRRLIARNSVVDTTYRTTIGVVGGVIAIGGLALVPLPGPGWLIVFAGLAILGTEFRWAARGSAWLKRMLQRFWAWWQARRERKRAGAA